MPRPRDRRIPGESDAPRVADGTSPWPATTQAAPHGPAPAGDHEEEHTGVGRDPPGAAHRYRRLTDEVAVFVAYLRGSRSPPCSRRPRFGRMTGVEVARRRALAPSSGTTVGASLRRRSRSAGWRSCRSGGV